MSFCAFSPLGTTFIFNITQLEICQVLNGTTPETQQRKFGPISDSRQIFLVKGCVTEFTHADLCSHNEVFIQESNTKKPKA